MATIRQILSFSAPTALTNKCGVSLGCDGSMIILYKNNGSGTNGRLLVSSGGGFQTSSAFYVFDTLNLPFVFGSPDDVIIIETYNGEHLIFDTDGSYINLYSSLDGFSTHTHIGSSGNIYEKSAVVDTNDVVHLVWNDNFVIKYANSSNWATITTIDTGDVTNVRNNPVIAVENDGIVHVAWRRKTAVNTAYNICVANSSNWSSITAHTSGSTYNCSAPAINSVLDSSLVIVAWNQADGTTPNTQNIYAISFVGAAWDGASVKLTTESTAGRDQQNPFLGCGNITGSDYFFLIWEGKTTSYSSNFNIRQKKGVSVGGLNSSGITEITASAVTRTIYAVPRYATTAAGDIEGGVVYIEGTTLQWRHPTSFNYGFSSESATTSNVGYCIPFDTQSPTVSSAIVINSSTPKGGDTTVDLSVTFSELDPNTNTFSTSLDNVSWTDTSGDINTASPSVETSTLPATLDGNDRLYYKCTHLDDYSHQVTSSNNVYVKPRAPFAPTLATATATGFNVTPVDNTVDSTAVSPDVFEHKIYVSGTGANNWLQTDGSVGASAVWHTVAIWGTKTVTGLTASTVYTVYSVSRNPNNTATESANGSSSAIQTTSQAPVITVPSVFEGCWVSSYLTSIVQIDDYASHNGSYFVSSDSASDDGVYESTDGLTWNSIKSGRYPLIHSFGSYLYIFDNVNNKVLRSTDGVSWSIVLITTGSDVISFSSIIGLILVGTEFDTKIHYSTDGLTWNSTDVAPAYVSANFLLAFGSDIYVFLGGAGQVYSTNDGIIYTDKSVNIGYTVKSGCVFNSKMYVGTYSGGRIYESSDGSTWTLRKNLSSEVPTISRINHLFVYNSILYALCYNSATSSMQVWRSVNGSTWVIDMAFDSVSGMTDITRMFNIDTSLYICTYGKGIYKKITGNKKYTIVYTLKDADSTTETVQIQYNNGSAAYFDCLNLDGDFGSLTGITTANKYKMVTWDAGLDFNNQEVTSDIKVIATDSSGSTGNATSSSFSLDTLNPSFASGVTLTVSDYSYNSVTLIWSAAVTETNFSKYEIYFNSTSLIDALNKTGTVWDDDDDATLATKTTLTTTITGLSDNTAYYFAIFAKDTSLNYSTSEIGTSVTTYDSLTFSGYTRDYNEYTIGNVTVGLYRRDTGALILTTTSNSSTGLFTFTFADIAESYYIIGYKANLKSGINDNLTGESSEVYDVFLGLLQQRYSTLNVPIYIGSTNRATTWITKSSTKNTLRLSKTINDDITTTKEINSMEISTKVVSSISKTFVLDFQ
jgi:hypothetical protein